jgi:hypothetical protein
MYMGKNVLIVGAIFAGFSFFYTSSAFAAKKFVQKQTSAPVRKSSTQTTTSALPLSVKYRGDKLGLLFSFSTFSGIDSVDYSFTYTGNGVAQGAGGTIRSSNSPTSQRELLFGTCSSGVCTYHNNLTNARIVFSVHYSNGRTATKSYRIKTYR